MQTSYSQMDLREFDVQVYGHPSPGYMFMAPISTDSFGVVDHAGKNAYKFRNQGTLLLQPQDDGSLLCVNTELGVVLRMNARFQVTDTLRYFGLGGFDFHECKMTGPNQYVILGSETRVMDLSKIVPNGRADAIVMGGVIQEVTLQGEILFEWHSLDHIPVTQATSDVDMAQQRIDYIHINSVNIDADGNFLVSCRHLDQVIKLNRTTGAIIWQMGGSSSKKNDFTFENDLSNGFVGFSHQHDAQRLPNGNMVMFDNGNLKPIMYSRVVEYEVNELQMKVKRVWEYRKTPDVFTAAKGSVQVLSNGKYVIGWGGSGNNVTAEEVDRDKKVHAVWLSPPGIAYASYRAKKSVFAMTGIEKNISTTGQTEFKNSDSSTHVILNTLTSTKNTSVIVERHSYPPHKLGFATGVEIDVLPTRWVVRAETKSALTGKLIFKAGSIPSVISPRNLKIYRRPVEGGGQFSSVPSVFDTIAQTITIDFETGEYLAGYLIRMDPEIVSPAKDTVIKAESVTLKWRQALEVTGYNIAVSKSSTFASFVHNTTTTDTTFTAKLEYGTQYYWRVRAARSTGSGNWISSTFTTGILNSKQVSPVVASGDWNTDIPFKWRASKNALKYKVVITDPSNSDVVLLDTLVSDTTVMLKSGFRANASLKWKVRPERFPIIGDWTSDTLFTTGPPAPFLTFPIENASGLTPIEVKLAWNQVEGVRVFRMQMRHVDSASMVFDNEVEGHSKLVSGLAYGATYEWRGRSIGNTGAGEWGSWRRFTTAYETIKLAVPTALTPQLEIEPTNVLFSWTSVSLANMYRLQVTIGSDFDNVEFEVVLAGDTSTIIPFLSARTPYTWRVRAELEGVVSRWSDTIHLSTLGTVTALTPISPAYGSKNNDVIGRMSFILGDEYGGYKVEISYDSLFAVSTVTSSVGSPTPYGPLAEGQLVYWRVIGLKKTGGSDTGSTSHFTTTEHVATGVFEITGENSVRVSNQEPGVITVESSDVELDEVQGYSYSGVRLFFSQPVNQSRLLHIEVPVGSPSTVFLVVRLTNASVYCTRIDLTR